MPLRADTRLVVLASLAFVSMASTGCGGSDNTSAGAEAVAIKEYAFAPATSSVRVGDVVTFRNRDKTEHTATVTGVDGLDTGTIDGGGTGSIRFTKAGRFTYICVFHPYMKGSVVVTNPTN